MPAYVSTTGPEALELCSQFGLRLDPWQGDTLTDSLGERPNHKWAASEVGNVVARQNGKSEIIIARMLAGLFLLEEEEIIYSAHRADTSMKIFQRFVKYLKRNRRVKAQIDKKEIRVVNTHGQEGVILDTGQSVGFRTRAQEGGRGFSADCIFFDEAFELSEEDQAAILPTLIAKPNPQVWYVGTPVDQQVHRNGVVFARIREKGLRGDPATAFFEWSVDASLDDLDRAVLDDPEVWAQANPSLGYQANVEMIAMLRGSMKARKFATECLCVGDWPDTDEEALHVVDLGKWDGCADPDSEPMHPLVFSFDVSPGQSSAAIGVSGERPDGLLHVDVESRRGTAWVAPRLSQLVAAHSPSMVVCDASGPASSVLADVEREVGEVHKVTAGEHAAAFGMFTNAVLESPSRLRHRGSAPLRAAIEGATTRAMGDGGLAWSRKHSEVDISPLVAATLAAWAVSSSAVQYTNVAYASDVVATQPEQTVGAREPRVISQAEYTTVRVPPRE